MNINNPIPEGYILLSRKVRKSPLWMALKATHRIVMIEILLQAQFQDNEVARNGEIISLKRGQLATSYQQLVNDINDKDITVKVVRNAINKLVKYDFVAKCETKARAKKGLLLTVVNYDVYQNPDNYKGKDKDKDKGKARAKQGQSKGKEGAINNNVNNSNNDNIPYAEIINYLNDKTGSKFRNGRANKEVISARWNEGHATEDFKKVIDYCSKEWSGKTFSNGKAGDDYLKPSTLFNGKFDERLNVASKQKQKTARPEHKLLTEENMFGED